MALRRFWTASATPGPDFVALLFQPGQEVVHAGTGNREVRGGENARAQGNAQAAPHEARNAVYRLVRDNAAAGDAEERRRIQPCCNGVQRIVQYIGRTAQRDNV